MVGKDLLEAILEHLSDGVYFVDTDRVVSYWNKGAERITGFKASEVIGRKCADNVLVHVNKKGTYLCKNMCPLAATIRDGKERSAQIYLRHKGGYRQPVHVSVVPIRDSGGKIIGGAECFYDNTQTLAAFEELDELRRDSLICKVTGVGNRKFVEQIMERKIREIEMNGGSLAVLGFEIDRYDEYNRSFGQRVADIIAKLVAKTLTSNLNTYDFVGRWADKEFIVILTKLDLEDCVRVAQRLSILVSRSSETITSNALQVTVSGGACQLSKTDTRESVIDRARKLALKSKVLGGDRVTAQL